MGHDTAGHGHPRPALVQCCIATNWQDVEVGSIFVHDGVLVKLMQITHSKPGKTGCPKSHCVLVDLATGEKKERLFRHAFGKARRTDDTCDALHVQRTEYTLTSIDADGFISLLSDEGTVRETCKATTMTCLKGCAPRCNERRPARSSSSDSRNSGSKRSSLLSSTTTQ